MLDVRRMRVLREVAVRGSFSAAAESLSFTQSAISQQIAASVKAAEAIQPPFDREITGGADGRGSERIERTTAALTLQSKTLVEAANAVGIERLNLVQPE